MLTRYHRPIMSRMLRDFVRDVDDLGNRWLDIDMTSNEKNVIVEAAVPGAKEDEIDVQVQDDLLTISVERRTENKEEDADRNWYVHEMHYGQSSRTVRLPEAVNVDKTEATLENGILTVKLPRETPGPLKRIAVKAQKLLKSDS